MQKAVLIGRGYWGKILYPYIQKHYIVSEVCGKDTKKECLEQILKDADSVFIATPLSVHYPLAKLGLECKCHVFLEKPSCKTQNEFNELKNLALKQNKILFTDYIYTFSESIRFGVELLKNRKSIESIHAEITQYGNFYDNESVLEVIGVHYFSVFAYMQNVGLFHNLCVKSCEFLDSCKQSALVKLCALRNNGDLQNLDFQKNRDLRNSKEREIEITLKCSLISQTKKRSLSIQTKDYTLCIDMLSKKPLTLQENNKLKEMPIFDETNNLEFSLQFFKQINNNKIAYSSHLNLCQTILNLLSQTYEKSKEKPC